MTKTDSRLTDCPLYQLVTASVEARNTLRKNHEGEGRFSVVGGEGGLQI